MLASPALLCINCSLRNTFWQIYVVVSLFLVAYSINTWITVYSTSVYDKKREKIFDVTSGRENALRRSECDPHQGAVYKHYGV